MRFILYIYIPLLHDPKSKLVRVGKKNGKSINKNGMSIMKALDKLDGTAHASV
jgi:hypothetical protein